MGQSSSIFTNYELDANRSHPFSKSKTYTNRDLDVELPPDIMDEELPQDVMDLPPDVMDEEISTTPANKPTNIVPDNAPDTFSEGFINSIMSGEALNAGLQGAKGFLKGATIDIPQSIASAIEGGYNLVTDPVNTIKAIPGGIKSGLKSMYDTTMRAGSEPEAFGRMMGQTTGQPLTTAGLVNGAPSAIRGVGAVAETGGRIMRRYAPVTATPVIGPMAGRGLTRLERMAGHGIETVGKKMRQFGKAEVPNEPDLPLAEQIVPEDVVAETIKPTVKPRARLNPDGTYTNLDTGEIVDSTGKAMATPITPKPDIMDLYPADGARRLIKEGEDILNTKYPPETPKQYHPAPDWPEGTKKQRLHELMDKAQANTLTPEELLEAQKLNKELRNHDINPTNPNLPKKYTIENAPPNQRAKILRGMNDGVDVLFDNPTDREIFGAGSNLFNSGVSKPGGIEKLIKATDTVSTQFGIDKAIAQKAIKEYNSLVRSVAKSMPKHGEGLNFTAPSFESFLKTFIPSS